ncbi:MAG: chromate efflux transporter [Cytophagaceae bacterium]|nr:chromate efflux transporter [Cytophagaceae bacterium]
MRKSRHLIFLRDVLFLTLAAFGGPQAHVALFLEVLVKKRNYISEQELIDLNSFCQILPGPASTQTLTAVGFRIGGPKLAFLTLLVWILPACLIMTMAAIGLQFLSDSHISLDFARFIEPMAVGLVFVAAYKIGLLMVNTPISYVIYVVSAVFCFFVKSPAVFPIVLIIAGAITSYRYREQQRVEKKEKFKVEWANLILYGGIFVGAALLGKITDALPIRLFENFFRNGSLIFGGGEALSALFYKEFVVFKEYLEPNQFLTGYALQRTLPGPLFSFSSFIGGMAMKEYGVWGQALGGLVGAAGIFLPGTILIFFLIRIWDNIKQYRVVKAAKEGLNAASAGVVIATALILFWDFLSLPVYELTVNTSIVLGTFAILVFTKLNATYLIMAGFLVGIACSYC